MLRKIFKQKRYFKNIYKAQKGITGLETAIILIAFVVVAAVFAYTVLSAGLFSTQKAQEAVYNGLQETQNTLVVKGAVLSESLDKFADTCDAVAGTIDLSGTETTSTQETTTIHEGTGALKSVTTADADNGDELAPSQSTGTVVAGDVITFWAKTDGALAASFGLHTTVDLSAGTDHVAIDAAHTNWHQYSLTVTVAGAMYYGIYATGVCNAETFYVDDIKVTPYADNILLTLSLPNGGASVDFSPGTDVNGDGLFSGSANKIVVNYNDAYTHLADVAWAGTFIGNNNNDAMLDPGEKIKLTISLEGVTSNKVDANHQFTLEVKSPKGAILSLQRTMPARLYTIDNLN